MADELRGGDLITLVLPDGTRIARSAWDVASLSRTTVPELENRLIRAVRDGVIEFSETEELTFLVSLDFMVGLRADQEAEAAYAVEFDDSLRRQRARYAKRRRAA